MKYRIEFRDVGREKRSFALDLTGDSDDPRFIAKVRKAGGLASREVSLGACYDMDEQDLAAVEAGVVFAGMHVVGRWRAYAPATPERAKEGK